MKYFSLIRYSSGSSVFFSCSVLPYKTKVVLILTLLKRKVWAMCKNLGIKAILDLPTVIIIPLCMGVACRLL